MSKKGGTLNFTGFSGYYGAMSAHDGYGGLNYSGDFEYMNTTVFALEPWCNQGYVNVAAATGASALGWIYLDGEASSTKKFTLTSMEAASAWSTNQEWTINTYTLKHGSYTLKGSDTFYISQSVETIKLGKIGKNINAFLIEMDTTGSYGNTCSYGGNTSGYQLCIGDVKIKFGKKKAEHSNGKFNPHINAPHHAHVAAQVAHHAVAHNAAGSHQAAHHTDSGYHSQLLSLHHDSGLTSQFHLPQVEHGF
jgi:hypothetical protein